MSFRRYMATILLLVLTIDAHAYLDPGTGSLILQVILGGIAGAAVAIKLFWHRILAFFGLADPEDIDIDFDEESDDPAQ